MGSDLLCNTFQTETGAPGPTSPPARPAAVKAPSVASATATTRPSLEMGPTALSTEASPLMSCSATLDLAAVINLTFYFVRASNLESLGS